MITAVKNIALICNPTLYNTKALQLTDRISMLLKREGVKHSTFAVYWPEHWEEFTEIWIIGGDGTANWLINRFPDLKLPLALFGGGSGNDLHWTLYGDISVEHQVMQVLRTKPRHIDAGSCNGKLFLNGVGIGFDGAIVKDLLGKRKLGGKASYLLSILKHIVGYHEKPCTLKMPAETLQDDYFMISVTNGKRFGGGFMVTPIAVVDDGLLDVNIVSRITALKRLRYMPVIEKGEHLALPFVQYRQVKQITITSPVMLPAHLDGEYMENTSFEITILPGRFSVLV
jgi:diacylglycerol kinase (ATP)